MVKKLENRSRFLLYYIKSVLGSDWGNRELAKGFDDRHPILQWYQYVTLKQSETIKGQGKIHSVEMSGVVGAYLHLAYDLYLIAHNEELQARLVERLKRIDQFRGALYEVRVAAAFVRAGFTLEFENEGDRRTSHCEFTATCVASGNKYSVEAKGRLQSDSVGAEKFRWGMRLQRALAKKANHPRILFLDVNIPDNATDAEMPGFLRKALDHIRRFEGRKLHGNPLPPAYVFVTNFPFHYHPEGTTLRAAFLTEGFQIPDFKGDASFSSIHDAIEARDKHADMHQVHVGFKNYLSVPSSFHGEIPEFEEEKPSGRLLIGNWYLIPDSNGKERAGRLQSATVMESKQAVIGIFVLEDGNQVIAECPLSDSEMRAYTQHSDTFFGKVEEVTRNISHPIEMYDWVLSVYKNSPKETLLKLMGAENDERLKEMQQEQLAKLYSEQIATAMMARTKGVQPNQE